MRVRPPLAPFFAAACLVWPLAAAAAQRDASLTGDRLKLADLCAARVEVTVDPALHDQVAFSATAQNQEEIDRLALESGSAAWVHPARDDSECWHPASAFWSQPTLVVSVRVPALFELGVSDSGSPHYRIGAIGPLGLQQSGSGEIEVASVRGKIGLSLSGSASVKIDQALSDNVTVNNSGSAEVIVPAGRIDNLVLHESGSGTTTIGATVGDATVVASGSGDVRLASVSGTLTKVVDGDATVSVGGR